MSFRQCLQIFHPVDVEKYLAVLRTEFDALENPYQPDTYLVDNPPLPFYRPQWVEDHLAIVSFNYLSLSPVLLQALARHPELAPLDTGIVLLEEQDLIVRDTVEGLHRQLYGKER